MFTVTSENVFIEYIRPISNIHKNQVLLNLVALTRRAIKKLLVLATMKMDVKNRAHLAYPTVMMVFAPNMNVKLIKIVG